jgi:hypothetical protein
LFHDYIFKIQYIYRSNSSSLGFGNKHICFILQGSLETSEEPCASEETKGNEEHSNTDNMMTHDKAEK